jgi:hypothetical protein
MADLANAKSHHGDTWKDRVIARDRVIWRSEKQNIEPQRTRRNTKLDRVIGSAKSNSVSDPCHPRSSAVSFCFPITAMSRDDGDFGDLATSVLSA